MKSELVKIGSRTKVNPFLVIALTAVDNYSLTHLCDGRVILTSTNLGLLAERFDEAIFFRTNRSALININHMKSYDQEKYLSVKLKNNLVLSISRRKRKDFKEKIEGYSNL